MTSTTRRKTKPVYVYVATKLDIAQAAGGPMGSPTLTVWENLFSTLDRALGYCEQDHRKTRSDKLKWRPTHKTGIYYTADYGGQFQYEIIRTKLDPKKLAPGKDEAVVFFGK